MQFLNLLRQDINRSDSHHRLDRGEQQLQISRLQHSNCLHVGASRLATFDDRVANWPIRSTALGSL